LKADFHGWEDCGSGVVSRWPEARGIEEKRKRLPTDWHGFSRMADELLSFAAQFIRRII